MSLDVSPRLARSDDPGAHVEAKKTRRPMALRGSRHSARRDNIENAQSISSPSLSLAKLPVQKQSTRVRKRLFVEVVEVPVLPDSNRPSTKRLKSVESDLVRCRSPVPHRTLSDISSILNQPSTLLNRGDTSLTGTQTTLVNWTRGQKSKHPGMEEDDSDDEYDALQICATPSQALHRSRPKGNTAHWELDQGDPAAFTSDSAQEYDFLGSDSTLTSPDDDTEDSDDHEDPCGDVSIPVPQDSNLGAVSSTSHVMYSAKRNRPGRPRKAFSKDENIPPSMLPSDLDSEVKPIKQRHSTTKKRSSRQVSLSLTWQEDGTMSKALVEPKEELHESSEQTNPCDTESNRSGSAIERNALKTMDGLKSVAHQGKEDIHGSDARGALATLHPSSFSFSSSSSSDKSLGLFQRDNVTIRSGTEGVTAASQPPTPTGHRESIHDHVFAIPTLPRRRIPSARATSARFGQKPRSKRDGLTTVDGRLAPAPSSMALMQHRGTVYARAAPRPILFQTCHSIMTGPKSDQSQPNIDHLRVMLQHALQRGLRKIQESPSMLQSSSPNTPTPTESIPKPTLQAQAWGATIGNGKGLFKQSARKLQEQARVEERRTIVANAYRKLDLPSPPPNWDKSSELLLLGTPSTLQEITLPKRRSGRPCGRWWSTAEQTLDQIAGRLSCEFCCKTYKNRNGLSYHMVRCPMARLKSIAQNGQGDSTDSETEDQRHERRSKLLNVGKSAFGSKALGDEYGEDESTVKCVCGSADDEGDMVQCDECKVWLHLECVGLSMDTVSDEYFCPSCTGQTPSRYVGGKFAPLGFSTRHLARRPYSRKRPLAPTRRFQEISEALSDGEESGCYSSTSGAGSFTIPIRLRLGTDSEQETNTMDSDEDSQREENAMSPQVILNHDWEEEKRDDPANTLGFEDDLFGGPLFCGAIFRKSLASDLMLDGSSSQDMSSQSSTLMGSLLSNELVLDNDDFTSTAAMSTVALEAMVPVPLELDPVPRDEIETQPPSSQGPFDYLPSTDLLFSPDYAPETEDSPDLMLSSEISVESEGLCTPVDLAYGSDLIDPWQGEEDGEVGSPELVHADSGLYSLLPLVPKHGRLGISIDDSNVELLDDTLDSFVVTSHFDETDPQSDELDLGGITDFGLTD